MARYHVRVVGGWCGNRIVMVADYLAELFAEKGYDCQVTHQSIWETYSLPPSVDLILQLMPAFTEGEASCPVINIKLLIHDLDHPPTINKILDFLQRQFTAPPGRDLSEGEVTASLMRTS